MMTGNELDAYIGGFHLDALTSSVSLNVDLDTTLTVIAGNLCRLLALKLSRYERATPAPCGATSSTPPAPCTSTPPASLRTPPPQPPPHPHRRRLRPKSPSHPWWGNRTSASPSRHAEGPSDMEPQLNYLTGNRG